MRNAAVASVLATMLAGACGEGASQQPNAKRDQAQESAVSVRLQDYVVEAQPASVPAGRVTFDVRNDGLAEDAQGDPVRSPSGGVHDLYVLRTDLPAADLPESEQQLAPDVEAVKPDLDAPGIEVLASIEPMEEGETDSLALDLDPGHYVLICNLIDLKGAGKRLEILGSHYARGMRTDLTVR